MSLLDVNDNVGLNYFDVDVVGDVVLLLMNDVHDIAAFQDVVVHFIPYDEMVAMRPTVSISRWTRMCDAKCFPLM